MSDEIQIQILKELKESNMLLRNIEYQVCNVKYTIQNCKLNVSPVKGERAEAKQKFEMIEEIFVTANLEDKEILKDLPSFQEAVQYPSPEFLNIHPQEFGKIVIRGEITIRFRLGDCPRCKENNQYLGDIIERLLKEKMKMEEKDGSK